MIEINIYTTRNTFILGLLAIEAVVGYYAAADKIRIVFQGNKSLLSQTVFPYGNRLAIESYYEFIMLIKRLLKLEIAIGFSINLLLFIFSYQITDLLISAAENVVFDMIIIEALAAESVVVGSDYGGNKEAIVDKQNGYLIKDIDGESFGEAILNINKNIQSNILKSAKKFDTAEMIKGYEECYNE